MHADLESIVCKFGGDPAICLREVIGQHELTTLATLYTLQRDRLTDKLIAAAAGAGGRSNKTPNQRSNQQNRLQHLAVVTILLKLLLGSCLFITISPNMHSSCSALVTTDVNLASYSRRGCTIRVRIMSMHDLRLISLPCKGLTVSSIITDCRQRFKTAVLKQGSEKPGYF